MRRRDWRIRWCDIGKRAVDSGKPIREALAVVATDAAALMDEHPTLRSEIDRALDEWLASMREAVAKTVRDASPKPKLRHAMSEPTNTDAGRALEGRPNPGADTGVAPPAPGSVVLFRAALSGGWYVNPDAAGEIDCIAVNGVIYRPDNKCPKCHGTGARWKPGKDWEAGPCSACQGSGRASPPNTIVREPRGEQTNA